MPHAHRIDPNHAHRAPAADAHAARPPKPWGIGRPIDSFRADVVAHIKRWQDMQRASNRTSR